MCGIAGIVHLDGSPANEERDGPFLREAAARLAPRGPDDERFLYWKNVGLAFRRLSIVDPEGGQQPLSNHDDSIVHITNGEIYNHQELRAKLTDHEIPSRSDCAVIPYLYESLGLEYLSELNGMFATALLDRRKRKLYLSRDRLGIKPLFLYRDAKRLVFGSEIKAVLAHAAVPRRFDWRGALTYSKECYQPDPDKKLLSFFEEIEHVPGGTVVTVDLDSGKVTSQVYWSFESIADAAPDEDSSISEFVEAYASTLSDSTRLRLMSDAEYGLFLSGGIDSASVAALATNAAPSFHTFSVLSQSTITNGDAEHAHLTASALGLPNHQVLFDWRTLGLRPEEWKRILWACETPEAGAEQLYKYCLHAFARELRPGLKVMLTGQGSDEFNGGYSNVWAQPEASESRESGFIKLQDVFLRHQRTALLRRARADSLYEDVVPASDLSKSGALDRRSSGVIDGHYLAQRAGQLFETDGWRLYRSGYRYALQMFNLWHEDRTAAAHGIENRVPFLDHRLVELTLRVPSRWYGELFWDKAILRRAMAEIVPDVIRRREKVPFFVGEDLRYTRRMMYQLIRADDDALLRESLEASRNDGPVLDEDYLLRVVRQLPEDPEYAAMDQVIELVNMGLLAGMAQEPPARGDGFSPPVSEVRIEEWDPWRQEFEADRPSRVRELSMEGVPHFADGVLIAKCTTGDPGWVDEGGYYVILENELRFVIDASNKPWLRFLTSIDGKSSIEQILDTTRVECDSIWKHLEEALELGILKLRSSTVSVGVRE